MVKFLIRDVFRLPNELVITGRPQDGSIRAGMKSSDIAGETITINKIELNRKMLTESPQAETVGLHTNRLKDLQTEENLSGKLINFS